MLNYNDPASFQIPFEHLKMAALNIVSRHPDGIRQAEVAKLLGIPAAFDHNWITKHLLDGLVTAGVIEKSEDKLFTTAGVSA